MGQATLASYASPGDGERLYRAAADVFGFPAWQVLWTAVRTGSLGDILPDSYPGLQFRPLVLRIGDEPERQACMVLRVASEKACAAVVSSDGAAMLVMPALEHYPLDELAADLERLFRKLPQDTVVRVWSMLGTDEDVIDASAADLVELLIEAAEHARGSD